MVAFGGAGCGLEAYGFLGAADGLGLLGMGESDTRGRRAGVVAAAGLEEELLATEKLEKSISVATDFFVVALALEVFMGVGETVLQPLPPTLVMVTFLGTFLFLGISSSSESNNVSSSLTPLALSSASKLSSSSSIPAVLYSDPLSSPSSSEDSISSSSLSSMIRRLFLLELSLLLVSLAAALLLLPAASAPSSLARFFPPIIRNFSVLKSTVSTSPSS
mmetsp:Transcript_43707/g.78463  ORF Transcript_43707/g.78463 Transcript_43707/m.78463 type:complete len:219 (-) Transcript_43707:491-1147(-)